MPGGSRTERETGAVSRMMWCRRSSKEEAEAVGSERELEAAANAGMGTVVAGACARGRKMMRGTCCDRGAESDRGRTLIRWGEPTQIEAFADARAAGASWEVWDYPERDLRLFFFDAHGSGDFRLRRQEPLG